MHMLRNYRTPSERLHDAWDKAAGIWRDLATGIAGTTLMLSAVAMHGSTLTYPYVVAGVAGLAIGAAASAADRLTH